MPQYNHYQEITHVTYKGIVMSYQDFLKEVVDSFNIETNSADTRYYFHSDDIDNNITQINQFKINERIHAYLSGTHILIKFIFTWNGDHPHILVEYRKIMDARLKPFKGKTINRCDFSWILKADEQLIKQLKDTLELANKLIPFIREVEASNKISDSKLSTILGEMKWDITPISKVH